MKVKVTLALIVLSIWFRPLVTFAQTLTSTSETARPTVVMDLPLTFDRLSLEEGLSQSTVYDILQDRRGFMWFATADGLNRFDGYTFTAYSSIPFDSTSLSDGWTLSLYEDRSDALWVRQG